MNTKIIFYLLFLLGLIQIWYISISLNQLIDPTQPFISSLGYYLLALIPIIIAGIIYYKTKKDIIKNNNLNLIWLYLIYGFGTAFAEFTDAYHFLDWGWGYIFSLFIWIVINILVFIISCFYIIYLALKRKSKYR